MAKKSKSNWDVLSSKPVGEQSKYRNVFEEQQLERMDEIKKISPMSRKIMLWGGTFIVALFLWVLVGLTEMGSYVGTYGPLPEGSSPSVFFGVSMMKIIVLCIICIPANRFANMMLMRSLNVQNAMADNRDINDHHDDQHIALPEEVMAQYDWFPDVGAHSSVSPSTMVSHVMLENKGIHKVDFVEPDEGDLADQEDEFYARITGDTQALAIQKAPMFDRRFGDALFEASGLPKDLRKWFDARHIPYNPGSANREKLKGYETVADLVNGDWELPLYEVQRPAGAYIVDGAPVNTMVLAITRAGKGNSQAQLVA